MSEWLPQKNTSHANTTPPEGVKQLDSRTETLTSAGSSTSATAHYLGTIAVEEGKAGITPVDE